MTTKVTDYAKERAITVKHKPEAIKWLLGAHDLSIDATTALKALERAGVICSQSYVSTSGSGEIKSFRKICDSYLRFGVNAPTAHIFRTEPKFHKESFADLMVLVVDQIKKEVQGMQNI